MKIIIDDEKYQKISEQFVGKFVVSVVSVLHRSPKSNLDVFNITRSDRDFVYDIAFTALAEFESHNEIKAEGDEYYANCVFSESPERASTFIASDRRIDLHGRVDDLIIDEAFKIIRRRND